MYYYYLIFRFWSDSVIFNSVSIKFRDPSVLNFKQSVISKKILDNHKQAKSVFIINFKGKLEQAKRIIYLKINNVLHTVPREVRRLS